MANSPLRSMTGFARARRALGDGELVVSVKTLNHRALDVHVHAPSAADAFENAVRTLVKSRLSRGHVEVRIVLPQGSLPGSSAALNRTQLGEYLAAFRQAAAEHGLDAQPDLNAALRIPGMFGEGESSELPPGAEVALLEALGAALDELNAFREREGAQIASEMRGHNTQVRGVADEMQSLRANAQEVFQ
ncbi:MAG TPA: YicC/YloC family endoribonuclease, partial [Bryobacteraceae bacterium]|nr:YicC/YloC family endoribonuclease [Bryobacteraceae bacterium]